MATQVIKWEGANGTLHDTEAKADQSLADAKALAELVDCLDREGIYWRNTDAEEVAITLLRVFTFTRRPQ